VKLTGLTPTLYTRDIRGSVDFYVNTLGFERDGADGSGGVAFVRRDGVEIMFAWPNTHMPFDGPLLTGTLYIRCDDVDAIWERVKDTARVCYPVEDFDYGMREFAIFDNNGYVLQFGQEIDAAS
jgi:uncharacterized glyoxalase superfamily protein PhnB